MYVPSIVIGDLAVRMFSCRCMHMYNRIDILAHANEQVELIRIVDFCCEVL